MGGNIWLSRGAENGYKFGLVEIWPFNKMPSFQIYILLMLSYEFLCPHTYSDWIFAFPLPCVAIAKTLGSAC